MEGNVPAAVTRQTNRRQVYQYIYQSAGNITVTEASEALSLDLDTVSGSVDDLVREGLVSCSAGEDGGPRAYALEPKGRVAVGVCILDDRAQLLAIDMRAGGLGFRELPTPFVHTPAYYRALAQSLEEFIDGCGLDRDRLLGVGIAMPAIMDLAGGRILTSPTLELEDVPLEEIYCHFSHYPVFIENTPNASGYAERWANKEKTNVVYFSLDRGVGGAILQGEGQYLGDHGRGGEFGHMRLVPNGKPCKCGRRGCVESYCSASRLSDDLGLTLDEFFARLRAGDEQAAEVWEEYRSHLTDAIVNLRICFDCDIILGGALSPYLEEVLPEICWEVGEKTLFEGDGFFISLDHFGARSACTGTALRFIDDFLLTF